MTAPYAQTFARHETFIPRYGWLRKAVISAGQDPAVFVAADATLTLGVGKNMVRAIRYWGRAFRVIAETPLASRPRLAGAMPTPLGLFLLGPDGADPYLESPTSLWLLHWQLTRRGSLAPVWYLTFNRFPHRDFDDDLLVDWLAREVAVDGSAELARSSLGKDVSCLLRMYGPAPTMTPETLVSPFANLRLVDRLDDKRLQYRITYGPKSGLPPELVALVAIDLMRSDGADSRSIGIGRLATAEGAPGRVFALSENEIITALEAAKREVDGFSVGVFAGARRLVVDQPPETLVKRLIARLFPTRPFDLAPDELLASLTEDSAA